MCYAVAWLCLVIFLLAMGVIFAVQVKDASGNPSINLQVERLDQFPKTRLIAIWQETGTLVSDDPMPPWPAWPDFAFQGYSEVDYMVSLRRANLVRPRPDAVTRKSVVARLGEQHGGPHTDFSQIRLASFSLPFTFDKTGDFHITGGDVECMTWGLFETGWQGSWGNCDPSTDVLVANMGNWTSCCINPEDSDCNRGPIAMPVCTSGVEDTRHMPADSWPPSSMFLLATSDEDAPKSLKELTDIVTQWAVDVNQTETDYRSLLLLTKLTTILQNYKGGVWLSLREKPFADYAGVQLSSYHCKGAGCTDPNVKITSKLVDLSSSFYETTSCAVWDLGNSCKLMTLLPDWDQTVSMGTVLFTYNNAISQLLSYANTGNSVITFLFPTMLSLGTMYYFGSFKKEATQRYNRVLGVEDGSSHLLQLA